MEVADRIAVITGASGGIGAATAERLAAEGFTTVLAARREERLAGIAEEIETAGGEAAILPLDLADEDSIREAIGTLRAQHGSVDVLVNNAGIGDWQFAELDPPKVERIVRVNLLGLETLTLEVVSLMPADTTSHVVNVSSMAGRAGSGEWPIYSSTKAGVNNFSDSLARRFRADPIRVTLIEPGTVDTPMQSEELRGSDWILQPADVADAIVYAVTRPPRVGVHNIALLPARRPAE